MNAIQCKLARVALGLGVRELAKAAHVSTQTVSRLEAGDHLRTGTIDGIRKVLEELGVEFIAETDVGGVGVRLKKLKP